MKIALIMVKGKAFSFKKRPFVMKHLSDSLTMGMLYAIIKNAFPDIEIDIYDETVEIVKKERIEADLVGISAITPAYYRAVEYSKYFKSKNIPVFLGGVHATLAPDLCVNDFDSVISGLANESLVELINDFKNNNLKKIYKQKADMSFENFVFPNRTLYEEKHFLGAELNMVQATFGCTNVCKFCVQPSVCQGYHQRPAEDVIEEIKTIKSDYIEFVDPNFAKDINYLNNMCEKLKLLNKKWLAPVTLSIAKRDDILQKMKVAGCVRVLIGFESVNLDSIDTISKGFNKIEEYIEAVKKFHQYNIKVTGSFVLGLDGDTKETGKKTLKLINDAKIDYVRFTINTPFPGTEYYNEMKQAGRLLTEDYSLYDCTHCVIEPKNMTSKEVEKMFKSLWKKAYSLINIIKRSSYLGLSKDRFKLVVGNYLFGKCYMHMNF